jgi:glutamate formiminotransferase
MPYLAIPNVSEGRDRGRIDRMTQALRAEGATVLDVHSDANHHRSVFTLTAPPAPLCSALTRLAQIAREISLDHHSGVHPRLGGLDVCPIVPHEEEMRGAIEIAHAVGASIHRHTGLPIFFYAEAALRAETRALPDIRRGGLDRLVRGGPGALTPDLGTDIDPKTGVVCVGARGPLIAFNVNLRSELPVAESIAAAIRESGGGLTGVRALAFPMQLGICQVSMNLTQPQRAGIDLVFDAIAGAAQEAGADVVDCEVIGLVAERFLPDPEKQAARLLKQPGLCLETMLRSSSS